MGSGRSRREFLKLLGRGGLGLALAGLDVTRHNSLYYTNYDDSVSDSLVDDSMDKVRDEFREAGISMYPVRVPRGDKPFLGRLDFHLVITPEYLGRYPQDYVMGWVGPFAYAGRFGLPHDICCTRPIMENLERLVEGYSPEEADAHLISIAPNGETADYGELNLGEKIVNLAIHEVAHGYGASHLDEEDYYMGPDVWKKSDVKLHPKSVERMHEFLIETQEMKPEEIRRYRWAYIRRGLKES